MQDGVIVGSHPRGSSARGIVSAAMTARDSILLPPGCAGTRSGRAVDHGCGVEARDVLQHHRASGLEFSRHLHFSRRATVGAAALGTFLVAWATTDVLSKIGMFGLDNTIIAFIARSEAAGERARSRALFHLAVLLPSGKARSSPRSRFWSSVFAGDKLNLNPQMVAVLSVLLCAMPGVILYRICTAVSRGMKVMKHDIFSRGLTESTVTTLAFLGTVALGWKTFGPAIASIIGTGASGIVALILASSLFRSAPSARGAISYPVEARRLLSYAASISGYDLLNALIVRLDVIMLGCFIGRAPGVTLPAVGIYGAVVEVGSGLRKVNQAFNPIFAPFVAGMTAGGEQEHAAAAFSRVAQWMLWILLPLLAVMALAGSLILSIYGPAFRQGAMWLDIVALACGTNCFVGLAETVIMVQRPRLNLLNSAITCVIAVVANVWLIKSFGVIGAAFGILLPYVLLGDSAPPHSATWCLDGSDRGATSRHHSSRPSSPRCPQLFAGLLLHGVAGQITSAVVFLAVFGLEWRFHFRRRRS